jgi:O-acetyl-ADP-ribose deacetylase (regulator of RNase III)
MDIEELKARIELRAGDITEVEAEAVVNAANTDLILAAGVSGAIGRKGGNAIQEDCDRIGSVRLGDAVATTAGDLKAKNVIHAASMEIGHFATDKNIARATRSALRQAEELGLRTVAFPAIGTGVAAFPADKCAELMLREAAKRLARSKTIEKIIFVLLRDEVLEAFRQAFDRLEMPPPPKPRGRGRRSRKRRKDKKHGRNAQNRKPQE